AGLGGEVDDAVGAGFLLEQRRERAGRRDVHLDEAERAAAEPRELSEPRLLERGIVVVVDVVDADDRLAAREKRAGHMHADEAGGAGDDEGHGARGRDSKNEGWAALNHRIRGETNAAGRARPAAETRATAAAAERALGPGKRKECDPAHIGLPVLAR